MLPADALWLVDEPALDEPGDLLTIPEIKQQVVHDLRDDDLGFRSLLERPDAVPGSWWHDQQPGA